MKLALYKYHRPGWGTHALFDRLARLVKGKWVNWRFKPGRYSHSEIVINGLCYSSSFRDGGVRSKEIDLTDGHWDVVDVGGNDADALMWFAMHEGQKYDWPALGRFVFGHWWPQVTAWWFCSEACVCMLDLGEVVGFNLLSMAYAADCHPCDLAEIVGLEPR